MERVVDKIVCFIGLCVKNTRVYYTFVEKPDIYDMLILDP